MWNISLTILYHLVLLVGAHLLGITTKMESIILPSLTINPIECSCSSGFASFLIFQIIFKFLTKITKTECNYMIVSVLI